MDPKYSSTGEGEIAEAEPVDSIPVSTMALSPGAGTIECWSCRNSFGIPAGTPMGSILACPICQNHNRFGAATTSQGLSTAGPYGGGITHTTTVVAMPLQPNSIVFGANSRVRTLMSQIRCCWVAAVVLGGLMCIGGLYYGAAFCGDSDVTGESTATCEGSFYQFYAFLIVTGFVMAVLGGYGLYELRRAAIESAVTGQTPKIKNFKWTCHLGWILGTLMFIYSIVFLGLSSFLVLFVPQIFTPCICGVVIGPIVWVNCCCYSQELNNQMLAVQVNNNGNNQMALQSVQVQR